MSQSVSAVHLHLKDIGHSFEDSNVTSWPEKSDDYSDGYKNEVICSHLRQPGDGQWHHLSATSPQVQLPLHRT